LKPWHNIPLLSYLLLRGRCAYCGNPISLRYPLVELLSGLIYLFLFFHLGLGIEFPIYALFSTALIIISFHDLEHGLIPDIITLPGMAAGLAVSLFLSIKFLDSLIGLLVGGGLFLLIAVIWKGGMGGGDVKLGAFVGLFLGWKYTLLAIFIAFFAGAVVGIALILAKVRGRRDPIPFGPFISVGALISLLWGEKLIQWYLTYLK